MAMSRSALIEARLSALEAEVAQLKQKVEAPELPWWEKIAGTFANDPDYEKAMELGRKYRESLRPKAARRKPGKKASKKATKASHR